MTQEKLEKNGFEVAREIGFGKMKTIEMLAVKTPTVICFLEENDFSKTWGTEGLTTAYAEFYSDVKGQKFFGKHCVSVIATEEQFNCILFQQGEEADEALNILNENGEEAVVNYLSQWDMGESDDISTRPFGDYDKIVQCNGYTLSYNTDVGYIGLHKRVVEE